MKMTDGYSFEDWFAQLQQRLRDRLGIDYQDPDGVLKDYLANMDMQAVVDTIVDEYGGDHEHQRALRRARGMDDEGDDSPRPGGM